MSKSLATSNYKQKKSGSKLKPSEVIELVKMSVDIEQAAEHYLGITLSAIKGNRRTRLIRCPFHDEKTASFSISQERNEFKCFGCGVQGDVINLVALQESVSLARAAFIIAEDFGLIKGAPTPEVTKKIKQNTEDRALEQRFREAENKLFYTLVDMRNLFLEKVNQIKTVADLQRFGGTYHFIEETDYMLDLLTEWNDENERVDNFIFVQEWVKNKMYPLLDRKLRS